jgi:Xaa-Pro aminopeptidase
MEQTIRISKAEFEARVQKLVEYLSAEAFSGAVLFDNDYVTYFTDFAFIPTERPMALAVSASGERALFVPRLELEHAQAEAVVDRVDHYLEACWRTWGSRAASVLTPMVTPGSWATRARLCPN